MIKQTIRRAHMKAQTIDHRSFAASPAGSYGAQPTLARGLLAQARGLEILAMLATRAAVALIPALAIVVAATLAVANPDLAIYLQATLWTGGFLFMALAMESDSPLGAIVHFGIGMALPVLTLLSAQVAAELAVAAATLVAAWLAVAIFRRF
jgi:hypothetical protein